MPVPWQVIERKQVMCKQIAEPYPIMQIVLSSQLLIPKATWQSC